MRTGAQYFYWNIPNPGFAYVNLILFTDPLPGYGKAYEVRHGRASDERSTECVRERKQFPEEMNGLSQNRDKTNHTRIVDQLERRGNHNDHAIAFEMKRRAPKSTQDEPSA